MRKIFFLSLLLLPMISHGMADQVMCTMQYDPVCAEKEVQCITTPCDPVRKTYGNACTANADGAKIIFEGDCNIAESSPKPIGGQKDAHGCLTGAGYSWDTSMKECIRPWEFQSTVDWAYENKLTQFTTLKEFAYGLSLTRQEAAAFATRAGEYLFARESAMCKISYRDQYLFDTLLTPGISRACGMGLMFGNGGYFHPRSTMTRGEAIVVLVRLVDGKKLDETKKLWYSAYLDRAFELGLTFANTKGFDDPITRGEFIEWIKILTENVSKKDAHLFGTWRLSHVSGLTPQEEKEIPSLGVTLTFDEKNLGAKFCNSMGGAYGTRDGNIVAPSIVSTLMYCDGLVGKLEGLFELDGSQYSVSALRLASRSTGSTMQLVLTTKNERVFTFTN